MDAVGHAVIRERDALRATLAEVGPDAPTACGDWTTTDLAVHIVLGELRAGLPVVPFRLMVARGTRLDRVAGGNDRLLKLYRRRRGFEWAIARLGRPAPGAHLRGAVGRVSLLELWAHHEDVLVANGLDCTSGVDVQPIVELLTHYQRKALAAHGVRVGDNVRGEPADVARWLAGRAGPERLTSSIDLTAVRLGI